MTDTQTQTTGGTEMPLTHCHTCGRELPWNRIFLGDRAYCGAECLPAKTVDILPDPRIAALEADLAAKDARIAALEKERAEIVTYYEGMGDERDLDEARLEADLAEALGAIVKHLKRASGTQTGKAQFFAPDLREAAYILARHGRFRVSYDGEFTEGEWVNG